MQKITLCKNERIPTLTEVIQEMDYHFKCKTTGTVVVDCEIRDTTVPKSN